MNQVTAGSLLVRRLVEGSALNQSENRSRLPQCTILCSFTSKAPTPKVTLKLTARWISHHTSKDVGNCIFDTIATRNTGDGGHPLRKYQQSGSCICKIRLLLVIGRHLTKI